MEICFATHNQNKFKEIAKKLPEKIRMVSLNDLDIKEEIPETGSTLEENSLLKAEYVFFKKDISVFSDDSGLEVTALNGEPGVYSARYAGEAKNDEANTRLLLQKLKGEKHREASFKTVITLILNGEIHQFTGAVDGHIALEPAGTNGFGYDPVFIPDGHQVTFAQMSLEMKNSMSHRGRAVEKLMAFLNMQ